MKSLQDFIITYNKQQNLYNNLFEYHFYIDFISKYSYIIDESYGAYNGQIKFVVELAKFISNELKHKSSICLYLDKKTLDKETDFENIFFKYLRISYEDNIITGLNNKKLIFDKSTNLFNEVIINIDTTQYKTYNTLLNVLIHELTHAWEAYQRELTGNKSLYEITKFGSKYNKNIKHTQDEDEYDTFVKQIEYYLSKHEVNAFLSELNITLEKSNVQINDYNEALKLFKKNKSWENYIVLYNTFNSYEDDELMEFTEHYNKICSTKFTFNKLKKKINNKFEIVFQRILTNVPKIYFDYINNQRIKEGMYIEQDNGYIHYINNIKNYNKPNWIK